MAELNIMNSNVIWFVFGNMSSLDLSTNLSLISEFYMCEIIDDFIIINEVYRKAPYLPLISRLWGFWTLESGLVHNEAFIFSRRKDLSGVHFKCATLPSVPHIYMKSINQTNYQSIDGTFGDIWKEMQAHFNFTYWTVLSSDGLWGFRYRAVVL